MKKVLFVINTLGRAGAEVALMDLLNALEQKEIEISLFVLTGQGEMVEKLPHDVKLLNKTYQKVPIHSPEGKKVLVKTCLKALIKRGNIIRLCPYLFKNFLAMLKKGEILPDKLLWRVISDGADKFPTEYDLAVAYIEGGATYYVADHIKAKKKVAFVHTDYGKAGYTRKLDKDCYLHYDRLFMISNETKECFLKYYTEFENKTEIFNNLLDKKRIFEMADKGTGFQDEYEGQRILSLGRLVPIKEFEHSVKAMELLKSKGMSVRWYLLGEGEAREQLESLIEELGLQEDFLLPGAVENPYPYLKQADVYVHATGYEGKSIAIQEAQILGCPLLVSNCGGNREQVVHEWDGLICELNAEDISQSVLQLLSDKDKAKEYSEHAMERHKDNQDEMQKLLTFL